MRSRKIRVFGAGPSGASFSIAALVSGGAESIVAYDGECPYRKPCGEALLNQDMEIYDVQPPIVEEIREFRVLLDGVTIAEKSYSSPLWFIIDKSEWVSQMRREVERLGGRVLCARSRPFSEDGEIAIDARGPFSEGKKRIPIARAIVEGEELHQNVVLDFDSRGIGFYWMFPSKGGKVNAGYGSLLSKNPKEKLLEYIKRRIPRGKVEELSASVITIGFPKPSVRRGVFSIGEAAGTVFPLTGEGIRPSVYHSVTLAKLISEGLDPERAYEESFRTGRMGSMVRQMKLQERVLRAFPKLPLSARRATIKLLPLFIDRYLSRGEIPLP